MMKPFLPEPATEKGTANLRELSHALMGLRHELVAIVHESSGVLETIHPSFAASAQNLLQYLVFRRHDLRPLQQQLAEAGLSSLGRAEACVQANVDAVLSVVQQLQGLPETKPTPVPPVDFATGASLLQQHADRLLGPTRPDCSSRIMVTMPCEAAEDPGLIDSLVEHGMDCMRINCAHDKPAVWQRMIEHLRAAETRHRRSCKIIMDLAGPKIRTGPLDPERSPKGRLKLQQGDRLIVTRSPKPGRPAKIDPHGQVVRPACLSCSSPEVFDDVRAGERILFDDGKIAGVIETASPQEWCVRITRTKPEGDKLRADKGINLPDSHLRLSPLSAKDRTDLNFIAQHAEMVALSFVSSVEHIQLLRQTLDTLGPHRPAMVLKVETQRGFENLPALLFAAMQEFACGVMIARGDLAVECGFERLAEVQEEILWLCEAAHVPVIWATQVLETLAKQGLPSRAEITDAAMGHRAECVMLNKGPHIVRAMSVLEDIFGRMQAHQTKKRAMLRALRLADSFLNS